MHQAEAWIHCACMSALSAHVGASVTMGIVAVTLESCLVCSSAVWTAGAVRSGTVCSSQPNGSGPLGLSQ